MTQDNRLQPPTPRQNSGSSGNGGSSSLLKIAGIALIIALVVVIGYGALIGGYANKKYTDTTFVPLAQIAQLQTDINTAKTTLNTTITGLPTTITNTVATSISNVMTEINTVKGRLTTAESTITDLQNKIQTLNGNYSSLQTSLSQIDEAVTKLKLDVANINASITSINSVLGTYNTRITAIEAQLATPTPTTPNSNNDITITVSTLEEGAPYNQYDTSVTDNSTYSEIKIKVVNNSGVDLTDVVIDAIVNFDNCVANPFQTMSASGWGSWHIRTRAADAVEIRSSPITLSAGATKTVYIIFKSYALGYSLNVNNITTTSISNSDVQIISYSK